MNSPQAILNFTAQYSIGISAQALHHHTKDQGGFPLWHQNTLGTHHNQSKLPTLSFKDSDELKITCRSEQRRSRPQFVLSSIDASKTLAWSLSLGRPNRPTQSWTRLPSKDSPKVFLFKAGNWNVNYIRLAHKLRSSPLPPKSQWIIHESTPLMNLKIVPRGMTTV